MKLPSVLSDADLPYPELQAARLDGELFGIDECFSPIDEIELCDHRARSLSLRLAPKLIAEQRTAAWIYGALDSPPAVHELCAQIHARVRPASLARMVIREVVIDDCDLIVLGGMRVTTPLRTVVDLARFSARFEAVESSIILRLMSIAKFGIDECVVMLDRRRNLPGKLSALGRIRSSCGSFG